MAVRGKQWLSRPDGQAALPGVPRIRRRPGGPGPEALALAQIRQGLSLHGVPCWRVNCGAFRVGERFVRIGDPGLPDLIALVPERGVVFIEVKAAGGRLRVEQQVFRDACGRAGEPYVVARDFVADVLPLVRRVAGGGHAR